jgi:hypothetical protein
LPPGRVASYKAARSFHDERPFGNLPSEAALSNALPGDNRTQWGCWTRRIFPVSARDINASVRADN